ncbi:MAG: hypothetical protein IJA34_00530 [Lachnospiraceae bacterium]|nr:hypothetical protein [Lachnospiraceae bacterium]
MRVKTIYIADKPKCNLSSFPNFHISGSIKGMKEKYYGKDAFLVKCGSYIYNVSDCPDIYFSLAH